jgi:O-antigen/teichoic acid export membrane protein
VGAALSLSALGFAVASLFGPHGPACAPPHGSTSLDLTPLLLLGLATFAVVVDVRAVRRGDRFWGRVGLVAVSVAAIVTVAGGAFAFLHATCG